MDLAGLYLFCRHGKPWLNDARKDKISHEFFDGFNIVDRFLIDLWRAILLVGREHLHHDIKTGSVIEKVDLANHKINRIDSDFFWFTGEVLRKGAAPPPEEKIHLESRNVVRQKRLARVPA